MADDCAMIVQMIVRMIVQRLCNDCPDDCVDDCTDDCIDDCTDDCTGLWVFAGVRNSRLFFCQHGIMFQSCFFIHPC